MDKATPKDVFQANRDRAEPLLAKLKSTPEGDSTLLDRTCLLFIHEHAEANDHKNNGLPAIIAGGGGKLLTGRHSKMTGTMGDLYLVLANGFMEAGLDRFPTASMPLPGILA